MTCATIVTISGMTAKIGMLTGTISTATTNVAAKTLLDVACYFFRQSKRPQEVCTADRCSYTDSVIHCKYSALPPSMGIETHSGSS